MQNDRDIRRQIYAEEAEHLRFREVGVRVEGRKQRGRE
jgi:hypothetical protein